MRTLEQIIVEIIALSKEAITQTLCWKEILTRCERYLKLMGAANMDRFKKDLNTKLLEIKNKQLDHYVYRLQTLIEELNQYE